MDNVRVLYSINDDSILLVHYNLIHNGQTWTKIENDVTCGFVKLIYLKDTELFINLGVL
jgi:hypothetical protein